MKCLEVKIKTLSPVILTANRSTLMTNSENSISGAILRGVFAKKYISRHDLGDSAHNDADFRRFFFGGLRFVTAFPVFRGERSFMVPRSLQESKDGKQYNDMLLTPNPADYEAGFKTKKGLAVIKDDKIKYVSIDKNTTLHIDRHSEESRISGSSQDGGVFTYASIEAGQEFAGCIYGEDEILEAFAREISQYDVHCRIGRSHNTQYGHCRLEIGEVETPKEPDEDLGNEVHVRLETPLVTTEPIVDAKAALQKLLADSGLDAEVGDVFGGQEELYGYNSVWHLKLPAQYALAAGTVFKLSSNSGGWDKEALIKLFYGGLGLRREEGYGQLRLWKANNRLTPWEKEETKNNDDNALYEVHSDEVRRIAKIIIESKLETDVKMLAYNHATQQLRGVKGCTHALATLESLLGARKNLATVRERMQAAVVGLKSKSFNDHMKDMKIQGTSLADYFKQEADAGKEDVLDTLRTSPDYQSEYQALQDFALKTKVAEAKAGKTVFDPEIIGSAYYNYWLWFFRHARKLAQKEG